MEGRSNRKINEEDGSSRKLAKQWQSVAKFFSPSPENWEIRGRPLNITFILISDNNLLAPAVIA